MTLFDPHPYYGFRQACLLGVEMNITLSIDDEIVKKVRKIAVDNDTTLTAMVREYLTSVANSDTAARQEHVARLRESFQKVSRDMGVRDWIREDLHAR